jgi:capsular polysaccharide biosynthesis protein
MNTDEFKEYLTSLNVPIVDNGDAAKSLNLKKYKSFFLTSSGVAVKKNSLIRDVLFGNYNLLFFKIYAIKKIIFSSKVYLREKNYLIICNFWSNGYHHWLTEALLKLIVTQINYKDYILLIPAEYSGFALQSLAGFKFKNILLLQKNHTYFIKEGTIISNPVSGLFNSDHIKKLREAFVPIPKEPFRKIYISRRNEKLRTIVNENDLYSMLHEQGYEIAETQLMSFQEQVALFSETKEVISIHGAALTNIVFMQPGTKMVELYREITYGDRMNLCYYRLAEAAKINYNCYFFKIANKRKDTDRSDIFVDPEMFASIITS